MSNEIKDLGSLCSFELFAVSLHDADGDKEQLTSARKGKEVREANLMEPSVRNDLVFLSAGGYD